MKRRRSRARDDPDRVAAGPARYLYHYPRLRFLRRTFFTVDPKRFREVFSRRDGCSRRVVL